MTNPDIRWTDLFMRVGRKFTQINLFRRLAKKGIVENVPTLFNDNDTFIKYLESEESGWIIPDPEALSHKRQEMLDILTQSNVLSAEAAVDAACLVFAHSVVDAIVVDVVQLVADASPLEDWSGFPGKDRKVQLMLVLEKGIEAVHKDMFDGYIRDLCNRSLTKRIETLTSKCQPFDEVVIGPDGSKIVYDRERLERLDKARQEIIHRVQTEQVIPELDAELQYLREVCLHILMMVRFKLKLKVDIGGWFSQQSASAKVLPQTESSMSIAPDAS